MSYAQADELQQRAKELLSPRGSIAVDERTNVLIARDIAGNLNFIEELIRSLDTQTAQVLIEARIVEATSAYKRDVGIQWGGDSTFSPATGNPTGVAFPSSVGLAGGNYDNNTPTAGLSPFTRNVPDAQLRGRTCPLRSAPGPAARSACRSARSTTPSTSPCACPPLESSGLVRIVSAPRIMVLDNREARINQGTLIPFSQVSALGVQTTFQEAKLQLLVKPHVTADGSVAMHVKLNRDEPDFTHQTARQRRPDHPEARGRDGPARHGRSHGGHRRHLHAQHGPQPELRSPSSATSRSSASSSSAGRASDARNELVIFITPHIVNRAEAFGR